MPKAKLPNKRSPCPVACSLDIIGDRWTLLVIRDLYLGRRRFKEFAASPEGIPTNILADRLSRLVEYEIIEHVPIREGSKRNMYQLTPRGDELIAIMKAVTQWGLKHIEGARIMDPLRPADHRE